MGRLAIFPNREHYKSAPDSRFAALSCGPKRRSFAARTRRIQERQQLLKGDRVRGAYWALRLCGGRSACPIIIFEINLGESNVA
jgi:hypothetical protein